MGGKLRGRPSAPGRCLLALLQVLPSLWNTWSQDSRRHTAQSFFSAAQKKEWFLDKNHYLKWRGHAKAGVNYSDGVNTTKQIADTKINRRNVWLHSKLVPFLFLRSIWGSFIFHAFLVCLISSLPFYIHLPEQKHLFNFLYLFLSFIYSPLEFPSLIFPLNLPGVLQDFLQSAANRTCVILASHYKQYAADPSCQPASIPAKKKKCNAEEDEWGHTNNVCLTAVDNINTLFVSP